MGFPGGSVGNESPAVQEAWARSLYWEEPLEEGMTTHSRVLAWRIPWTEEPGGLQSTRLQRVGHDWAIKHSTAYVNKYIPHMFMVRKTRKAGMLQSLGLQRAWDDLATEQQPQRACTRLLKQWPWVCFDKILSYKGHLYFWMNLQG